MDDIRLLEGIHRIGQIKCSDPSCRACAIHRDGALAMIEQFRAEVRAEAMKEVTKKVVKAARDYVKESFVDYEGSSYSAEEMQAVMECAILSDESKAERC